MRSRRFLDVFPRHSVLLLDTYDVRNAMEKIIAMGRKPRGVRLDSGDVGADSLWVRQRLDEAGWGDVEIFISGDLDEDRIASLLASGARMDTFGVGTALVHIRRCAIRGHALQAGRGGARRPRAQRCKAQRRQSHVSGPQAGLPHFGRGRPPGRRRDRSRKRTGRGSRAAAGARDDCREARVRCGAAGGSAKALPLCKSSACPKRCADWQPRSLPIRFATARVSKTCSIRCASVSSRLSPD